MALIQPINVGQFNLHHDPFSFQQAFGDQFAGLEQDEADLATFEAEQATFDVAKIASFLTGDLDLASHSLEAELADPFLVLPTELNGQLAAGDGHVAAAQARIPHEGYQTLPEQVQPPPDTGGFIVEPGGPGGAAGGTPPYQVPGIFPLPGEIIPQVMLQNLTRPGAVDFAVGESFKLTAYGAPNSAVQVNAVHDGNPVPTGNMGTTNSAGYRYITGGFGSVDVGEWMQTWTIGHVPALPTLQFYVRAK